MATCDSVPCHNGPHRWDRNEGTLTVRWLLNKSVWIATDFRLFVSVDTAVSKISLANLLTNFDRIVVQSRCVVETNDGDKRGQAMIQDG
jgi:hypothetical protein